MGEIVQHGAAEDANQHLPGGAGPPPRDLPTLSVRTRRLELTHGDLELKARPAFTANEIANLKAGSLRPRKYSRTPADPPRYDAKSEP